MCQGGDRAAAIRAVPRPAPGAAVDPITLTPVDEVAVTVLVDNTYDALLIGDEQVRRPSFAVGTAQAPQFVGGTTLTGLVAEHGFGALVTVRRGDRTNRSSVVARTGTSSSPGRTARRRSSSRWPASTKSRPAGRWRR